jgi:DHA2 family lincomycin resistance protein-like MFS transporter
MAELANAMTVGSEHVFWFAMIVAVIGLVISFFIRRVIVSQASAVTSPH